MTVETLRWVVPHQHKRSQAWNDATHEESPPLKKKKEIWLRAANVKTSQALQTEFIAGICAVSLPLQYFSFFFLLSRLAQQAEVWLGREPGKPRWKEKTNKWFSLAWVSGCCQDSRPQQTAARPSRLSACVYNQACTGEAIRLKSVMQKSFPLPSSCSFFSPLWVLKITCQSDSV